MAVKVITSDKFQLIREDMKSLGIGLCITLVGALLTYLSEYVAKADFGQYTPLVVALSALLVNTVRKFLTEKKYVK